MGWTNRCRDQESSLLSQGFLMNNCVLDDYEKSKNRQIICLVSESWQKRDKMSLTLTEEGGRMGQCPREGHLECWEEIVKGGLFTWVGLERWTGFWFIKMENRKTALVEEEPLEHNFTKVRSRNVPELVGRTGRVWKPESMKEKTLSNIGYDSLRLWESSMWYSCEL